MIVRTLKRLAVLGLLGLGACSNGGETSIADGPAPDPGGWRFASGKMPSKAEFAALTASCQDRGGALDPCLADLGLKHAP
jgi:hypothetical protein